MKVFLLHRDRDFAVKPELRDRVFEAMLSGDLWAIANVRRELERKRDAGSVPAPAGSDAALARDLELDTLWNAMAAGDEFLFETAKRAVLSSLADPGGIVYRQRVLADCLEHPEVVGQLYGLAMVEQRLRDLEFKRGLVQSAELAKGLKGRRYVVRAPPREQRWTERLGLVAGKRPASFSFPIPPRDENGLRALEEIRSRGLNQVADAVAQSADHVKSFFAMLRLELAFYLGCLNLHARLDGKDEPTCFPEPLPAGEPALTARDIYDVCLTLHLQDRVVGNEVHADGKSMVMITGANQGGKSTLLRGIGLAQLMMQAGIFVGASAFRAGVCDGVFTHYKREEDATMQGGKLDEELRRMSQIADQVRPGGLLLCNESFASTNEREGSEIARQVVRAMLDKQVKVLFVTHMYDLAHSFHAQQLDTALLLRAERHPDGRRTFRLVEGEPQPTSYGEDSYRRVFATAETGPAAAETRR